MIHLILSPHLHLLQLFNIALTYIMVSKQRVYNMSIMKNLKHVALATGITTLYGLDMVMEVEYLLDL